MGKMHREGGCHRREVGRDGGRSVTESSQYLPPPPPRPGPEGRFAVNTIFVRVRVRVEPRTLLMEER